MASVIRLSEAQWARLHRRLSREYQHEPSVILIRSKMRSTLGFTVRRHREWIKTKGDFDLKYPELHETICLDFFDDRLETWFRIKYAEYMDSEE